MQLYYNIQDNKNHFNKYISIQQDYELSTDVSILTHKDFLKLEKDKYKIIYEIEHKHGSRNDQTRSRRDGRGREEKKCNFQAETYAVITFKKCDVWNR